MNKIFTLLIVFIGFYSVEAQIYVGPKVGLNLSQINYGEAYDQRFDNLEKPFKTGFQAGLAFDFEVNHLLSIYSEALYTQKGSVTEGEYLDLTTLVKEENEITLNYLEIPVLARIKIGGENQFYVNAGPTAGYWLGGKIKQEVYTNGILSSSSEEAFEFRDKDEINQNEGFHVLPKEEVSRFEVGAAIGAGMLFGFNDAKFNIDLRYTVGLTSIYDNADFEDDSWKNNTLSASIGYFFN